ncbi:MAG: glutathione S-transferase family protein [Pseudomonadales bacterium]|nr:glutathione S-transferase family protein [Pseudomonadales bacterium]
MPTVYGAILSPFVRKVRVCLQLKNLAYDLDPVFPGSKDPEFRLLSPTGKIPAFRDGDYGLADSSAICAYLEQKYPASGVSLFPEDAEALGKCIWLEEYADSHIFDNSTGKIFFPRVVLKLQRQEHDEAAVKQAVIDELPPIFDYLESQLGETPFIVGAGLTIADIAIVSQMVNLQHAQEGIDKDRWPKFAKYVAHHLAENYFADLVTEENAVFKR